MKIIITLLSIWLFIMSYNYYEMNKEIHNKLIPEIQRLTSETWSNEWKIGIIEKKVCWKAGFIACDKGNSFINICALK